MTQQVAGHRDPETRQQVGAGGPHPFQVGDGGIEREPRGGPRGRTSFPLLRVTLTAKRHHASTNSVA